MILFPERLSSTDTKTTETEKEEKPKSVLDNLFRKTTATPPIYWLPLSEKEASVYRGFQSPMFYLTCNC